MICREVEPLLFTERDGVLSNDQRAALERHAETCPSCRQRRAEVAAAMEEYHEDVARIPVPDVDQEWRSLRARLGTARSSGGRRTLAPLLWFGIPLGAAAAVAFAFFGRMPGRPQLGTETIAQIESASAEYVELADRDSSPLVYVDKDSGWLVVWAVDGTAKSNG